MLFDRDDELVDSGEGDDGEDDAEVNCGDEESDWNDDGADCEDADVESVVDSDELLPTLVVFTGRHEASEPATTVSTCSKIGAGACQYRSRGWQTPMMVTHLRNRVRLDQWCKHT